MHNLLFYAYSCAATIVLVKLLRRPAVRLGLVDVPSGRKNHIGNMPLTGGLAMFAAFATAVLPRGDLAAAYWPVFPALALLVAIGSCDDRFDLSAASRFAAQVLAALAMIWLGKISITDLGDLFGTGEVRLDVGSVPFTVFCVVGVINAVNMLDGIDGLAGGVMLAVLGLFGGLALTSGNAAAAALLFSLVGAVLGFAVLNIRTPWRARAEVFMGDAGSMMLGFVAAWFAVELTQTARPAFAPITAVWILAVPILDTVSLMLRRVLRGRSPFAPDHEHLHHIFLRAGFSVPQTVAAIILASLLCGLIGIAAWGLGVPDYVMFYAFLALFAAYFSGLLSAWKIMKWLRRLHDYEFG